MEIPRYIKHKHARDEGGIPYPCGYCIHYPGFAKTCAHPANIVMQFAEKDAEPTGYLDDVCNLNRKGPDDPMNGMCGGFSPIVLDYRSHCIPEVFAFLETDYMMYVVSRVYEEPGIRRSVVIDRKHKGYQTRNERINDLVEKGYMEVMLDIRNEEVLYCTATGDKLAQAVRTLYSDMVLIIQEGDILESVNAQCLFRFVLDHRGCTRPEIYEYMQKEHGIEDYKSFLTMERLLESNYIEGEFNPENWTDINYNITDRGLRKWNNVWPF